MNWWFTKHFVVKKEWKYVWNSFFKKDIPC